MLNENFVYVGVILNTIGGLSYLIDTLRGKVKPNRVTWFLWGVIPLIAYAAQIHEGVGIQSLLTFIIGFEPLLILGASFLNKKSYWKLSKRDFICGGLSIIGLILWYLTKNGNYAIVFSIFADATAGLPTLIKSYHHPETENYVAYLFSAIAAVITLLTIKTWSFATYSFPLYILVICTVLFILIKFKVGKNLAKV